MTRFFNYSLTVTPEYKAELDKTIKKFDATNDGVTYTPTVAALVMAIVGVIQTALQNSVPANRESYSNVLSSLQIAIPIVSTFIIFVCNKQHTAAESSLKLLIADGMTRGFFNTAPVLALAAPNAANNPQHQPDINDLQVNAALARIVYRR